MSQKLKTYVIYGLAIYGAIALIVLLYNAFKPKTTVALV